MPRPSPHRLLLASYPFQAIVPTRWADLDPLGHINNVSMAGLFEEGRGRFHATLDLHREARDIRWLIAAVSLNYVGEAHHPHDTIIASGIGELGTRSWTVHSAAFQNGICLATCDTVIVYTDKTGAAAFPEHFRAKLEAMRVVNP